MDDLIANGKDIACYILDLKEDVNDLLRSGEDLDGKQSSSRSDNVATLNRVEKVGSFEVKTEDVELDEASIPGMDKIIDEIRQNPHSVKVKVNTPGKMAARFLIAR